MTDSAPSPAASEARRFSPALLLLFVGSGCAALIYEVVWFHLLRLVIGTSAISIAVLLGSFMGGMFLGSLLFPRFVSRARHPLRVYAVLELGIGVIGIALPVLLPLVGNVYTSSAGSGLMGFVLRGLVCALCLLPPTILMGATLPAISRWMETTRVGIARMGFFYGANIAGAVAGTVLAGFFLLRVFDIMVATYVAFAINLVVGSIALLLARRHKFELTEEEEPDGEQEPVRRYPLVYTAIALSGFTALGAEVVWTRLLSLLMGATVYAFSLILTVFLVGLGLGSAVGSLIARRVERPRLALGLLQMGLAIAIAFSSWMILVVMPNWQAMFVFMDEIRENMTFMYLYDFFRCTVAMLPATFLWGASFPVALAAASSGARDPGRLVGGVYAANTIGAIAGSLVVGLPLIAWQGTQWTQQAMAVVAGGNAVALLFSLYMAPRTAAGTEKRFRFLAVPTAAWAVLLLVGGIWGVANIPETPPGLIAYGRTVDEWDWDSEYIYIEEGVNASVAVSRLSNGVRNFHVSGKIVASTEQIDMRLQRMLGHLPAMLHPNPKSVLIVGCGAGVTAGCFIEYPGIERIVICEIEPRVPDGANQYFSIENRGVLSDEMRASGRVEVILDDARHFLATTDEKFDIITSDPIHPWVRGAAALYSSEYYELVKERINPGAIVTQWVPFYQTNEESVKSQVGTFIDAFPDGTIWNSDIDHNGYDTVMMGQIEPMQINVDTLNDRIVQNAYAWNSLAEVDLGSAVQLLKTYAGQGSDLAPWLVDAQINHDVSLRLQYLAGLALDLYLEADIYKSMLESRKYPENLFVSENQSVLDELRNAFGR